MKPTVAFLILQKITNVHFIVNFLLHKLGMNTKKFNPTHSWKKLLRDDLKILQPFLFSDWFEKCVRCIIKGWLLVNWQDFFFSLRLSVESVKPKKIFFRKFVKRLSTDVSIISNIFCQQNA